MPNPIGIQTGNGQNGSSLQVTVPAAALPDDLILVFIAFDQTANQTVLNAPSGYTSTKLDEVFAGVALEGHVWRRLRQSGDTFTPSGSMIGGNANTFTWSVLVYRNVDLTTPVQQVTTAASNGSSLSTQVVSAATRAVLSRFVFSFTYQSTTLPTVLSIPNDSTELSAVIGSGAYVHKTYEDDLRADTGGTGTRTVTTSNNQKYVAIGVLVNVINQAPDSPTLNSPASGSDIYASQHNILSFDATDPDLGDHTSAYSLKVTIDSVTRYWQESDSTWQANETFNPWITAFPANNKQITVGPGNWFDAEGAGTWSVAVKDEVGAQSSYSSEHTFTISPAGSAGLPRTLFRHNENSTSETTVYFSVSPAKTIVKQIVLANTTAVDTTYSLSHVKTGLSAGDTNRLLKDYLIAARQTESLDLSVVLEPGDFISIKQGTAGAITATGYGLTS